MTVDNTLQSGISRHLLGVATEIVTDSRFEIAVCMVFPRGELSDALEGLGVKTFSLNSKAFNHPCVFGRFLRVMREYQPDIVHIHVITFWQWIYLALFARSVPTVFTIHSDYGKGSWQRRLMRRLMPLSVNRYIFVSKGVRDACVKLGIEGEVLYNSAPSVAGNLHSLAASPVIGTACKISAVKRPESFVRSMAHALQQMAHARAVVIGDGDVELMKELNKIVDTYGVSDRFDFTGYCKDAPRLINQFDVFVMTSIREGMPTAALEAMSFGIPIVFMQGRGGLIDLAEFNNGELGPIGVDVAECDESALTEGVLKLLQDKELYCNCSRNALRLCETVFTKEQAIAGVRRIYQDLAGK